MKERKEEIEETEVIEGIEDVEEDVLIEVAEEVEGEKMDLAKERKNQQQKKILIKN